MEVNKAMTPIYEQRYRAYESMMLDEDKAKLEVPGQFKDEFDERPGVCYYSAGGFLASARLMTIQPFFAQRYFDFTPEPNAVEASRFCVDPSVDDTDRRMKLLMELIRQIAREAWGKPLYTTATATLGFVYSRAMGFKHVEGTPDVIVAPGKTPVYLYRLDLADKSVQEMLIRTFGPDVVPK